MNTTTQFDGADYNHVRDHARLSGQIAEIFALMRDGAWRTLSDISALTGHPEASVSAQLRNLRKPRFGGHCVEKVYIDAGLYRYRIAAKNKEACRG
jgi:hypothetical protein